jgi:hypothetical protein
VCYAVLQARKSGAKSPHSKALRAICVPSVASVPSAVLFRFTLEPFNGSTPAKPFVSIRG